MIKSIQFRNFKVLRDTTLPLGRFTLMIGPNGSGKSTVLQALQAVNQTTELNFHKFVSIGLQSEGSTTVEVVLQRGEPYEGVTTTASWSPSYIRPLSHVNLQGIEAQSLNVKLAGIRIFSLHAQSIAQPVELQPNMELNPYGGGLAGVLDRLRDHEPERFEALNKELGRCLPEFDRILFDTPQTGYRTFMLRTRQGHHAIPAGDLSQGTLLALALLTLAYLPDPPPIVGLEEPDRGIHPRLLRDIQDALYRLSYPESFGEKRKPVQVVATTHSPYFLDLYRDHPEEVVIAHRVGQNVRFERLSDRPDIKEILGDAHLGDVWYSGILGGVPSEP